MKFFLIKEMDDERAVRFLVESLKYNFHYDHDVILKSIKDIRISYNKTKRSWKTGNNRDLFFECWKNNLEKRKDWWIGDAKHLKKIYTSAKLWKFYL